MLPKIALIGRPNVGKSTLFNRLVGRKLALVDDQPGVTRDRRYGEAKLGKFSFTVIDTAGLDEGERLSLQVRMRRQSELAMKEADLVCFILDAQAGVTPLDRTFAELVRKARRPVLVLMNKCEGKRGEAEAMEAFALGLGDPLPISAEHGLGMRELQRYLMAHFPTGESGFEEEDVKEDIAADDYPSGVPSLAIVGRPNVGKSTLINHLIGEDRLLTGPEAGITRDSITLDWQWRDKKLRLVDTAGLRKRARVVEKLEKLSAGDTIRAIRYASIVALVIDATLGLDKQDLTIARLVLEEGRGLVVLANKWDKIDEPQKKLKEFRERLDESLAQVPDIPLITISAATGKNLDKAMAAIFDLYEIWNTRLSTGQLNRWLKGVTARHPAPLVAGRRLKPRYITQTSARPPSFALFMNRPEKLPESYQRYLLNNLREQFKLKGVILRLHPRGGDNPFDRE